MTLIKLSSIKRFQRTRKSCSLDKVRYPVWLYCSVFLLVCNLAASLYFLFFYFKKKLKKKRKKSVTCFDSVLRKISEKLKLMLIGLSSVDFTVINVLHTVHSIAIIKSYCLSFVHNLMLNCVIFILGVWMHVAMCAFSRLLARSGARASRRAHGRALCCSSSWAPRTSFRPGETLLLSDVLRDVNIYTCVHM